MANVRDGTELQCSARLITLFSLTGIKLHLFPKNISGNRMSTPTDTPTTYVCIVFMFLIFWDFFFIPLILPKVSFEHVRMHRQTSSNIAKLQFLPSCNHCFSRVYFRFCYKRPRYENRLSDNISNFCNCN